MEPSVNVSTERVFSISGFQLAAKVWGPEDGVPVLALHGWLDNAASFDGLASRLSGVRMVALDLPGHGRSSHAGVGASYHFVDYVVAVHEVLDALGWQQPVLMGHSLGAGVAAVAAAVMPERIHKLVMIEGLGPLTTPADEAPKRLRDAILQARARRPRPKVVYADRTQVAKLLEKTPSRLNPASIETLLARGLEPVEGGFCWRADRRLRLVSRLRMTEAQLLACLRAITCPVLVIAGEQGFTFATDPKRLSALGDATLVRLSGRHHLHLDDPQPVARVVQGFI